jgi:hypothetical protein
MSGKSVIAEVSEATGGFARREHWTNTEFGGATLIVASDILDHRRKRALTLLVRTPEGREFHGRVSFDEDVTGKLLGDGNETIPACGPYPGGIDAQMFLRAIFDHAWEQGFRPPGFQDRPLEIRRLEKHLEDMRALVFKDDIKPNGHAG